MIYVICRKILPLLFTDGLNMIFIWENPNDLIEIIKDELVIVMDGQQLNTLTSNLNKSFAFLYYWEQEHPQIFFCHVWPILNILRKASFYSVMLLVANSQTDRQRNRETDRQAGRQTDRQTDRHIHRQTDRWTTNKQSQTLTRMKI